MRGIHLMHRLHPQQLPSNSSTTISIIFLRVPVNYRRNKRHYPLKTIECSNPRTKNPWLRHRIWQECSYSSAILEVKAMYKALSKLVEINSKLLFSNIVAPITNRLKTMMRVNCGKCIWTESSNRRQKTAFKIQMQFMLEVIMTTDIN